MKSRRSGGNELACSEQRSRGEGMAAVDEWGVSCQRARHALSAAPRILLTRPLVRSVTAGSAMAKKLCFPAE